MEYVRHSKEKDMEQVNICKPTSSRHGVGIYAFILLPLKFFEKRGLKFKRPLSAGTFCIFKPRIYVILFFLRKREKWI
jgi:hypothetical protein